MTTQFIHCRSNPSIRKICNYNEKPYFGVNVIARYGASGSPVFLTRATSDRVTDRHRFQHPGTLIHLVGVMCYGPRFEVVTVDRQDPDMGTGRFRRTYYHLP